MRKLVFLVMCMWSLGTFAQDGCETSKYVSLGLSMGNGGEFLTNSYNSLEFGIVKHDVALGLSLGRGNFKGMFRSDDVIENYFYELRVTPSFPLGYFNVNAIFGLGAYFNTPNSFIEYGIGFSQSYKSIGYGISFSNWDGVNYISPCISYNF